MLFFKFLDNPSARSISLVGLAIGLGMLTRSIIGSIAPVIAIYILFLLKDRSLAKRAVYAAILCIALFAAISPWTIRNIVVHRKFVLMMTTSGEALWRGNNLYATGTSLSDDGKPIMELWPEDFKRKVYALDELGQMRFFEREAKEFIASDPAGFLRRYAKKFFYFWWFSPQSGAEYPASYLAAYKLIYGALLFFAVVGLGLSAALPVNTVRIYLIALLAIIMAIPLSQSIFYVEGRHRFLIEPFIIIIAASSMTALIKFIRPRYA
jgi:hypothetical protein